MPDTHENTSAEKKLSVNHDHASVLHHFYESLQSFCYLTIGVLYLYDCHFLLVLLRWTLLTHFIPAASPVLHRFAIVTLINFGCIFTHLLSDSPTPVSNSTRGYLSGSVIIDLVGEFAHSSTMKLVAIDTLLFATQVTMMIVGHQRQRLQEGEQKETTPVAQDLDAEERGVTRSAEETENTSGDNIESQTLLPPGAVSDVAPMIEINMVQGIRAVVRRNATTTTARPLSRNDEAVVRALLSRVAAARGQR